MAPEMAVLTWSALMPPLIVFAGDASIGLVHPDQRDIEPADASEGYREPNLCEVEAQMQIGIAHHTHSESSLEGMATLMARMDIGSTMKVKSA